MLVKFIARPDFRLMLALAATAGLILVGPAFATVKSVPIRVRLAGPPRAAEPGQPFEGVLEIAARADADIEELFIDTGRSWKIVGQPLPTRVHLAAGETLSFPFAVISPDPTEPFVIEYQWNNETFRRPVDVSPGATAARQRRKLARVDDLTVTAALATAADDLALRPEPPPAPERHDRRSPNLERKAAEPPRATAAYNVRVVGYFHYRRMNDGAPVGVDGAVARVYDEDATWDEHLATQVLGPDGRLDVTFNWDPCFTCDGTPDIYVEFELDNAEIEVQEGGILEVDYTWETGVWNDFGGTYLDIGNQTPNNASEIPACHVMVNAMRAWRFSANSGRDTPKVDIQWPETDPCGACYNAYWEEIYLDNARVWNENTIVHEFGHHFVNSFATYIEPNYCVSGFCDPNPPEDCGHCEWCRETTEDAFSEGFPSYFGNAVMRTFTQPPVTPMRNYENLANCLVDNQPHDPWQTEAWFTALLVDMDDAAQDNDAITTGLGKDELTLGFDEIFWIVDALAPTTPAAFISRFNEHYPHLKEQMWATSSNNGYQYDVAPPGKVTNITSDHALNQNWDTRAIIKWFWDRAPDDASGIQDYSIWVQKNILPGMPDETPEVGDVTQYVSGPHTPGWYYISIRARDRNGTWSNTYETAGPFGIRAPDPANLKVKIHSNWDYLGVTARHVPDATPFLTYAPSYLDGTGGLTYLSAIYNNSGEVATNSATGQYWTTLFVDGMASAFHHRITPLQPFEYEYVLNKPVTIPGGRHIVTVWADETGLLAEPDELDNYWARQWAWDPPWVGLGAPAYYGSPPGRYAGTEWIVDGSAIYENCRGFRAQDELNPPNTMWTAMVLHANDAADYDLPVFGVDQYPSTGFSIPFTGSYRGAWGTDTFLLNSWQYGWPIVLDYGVTNYSGGVQGVNGFHLQKVTSQSLGLPGSTADVLGPNEMLKLYQFTATHSNIWARVEVQDPSQGRVYLTLLPASFSYGSILGAGTTVVTDAETGIANITEVQGGNMCLAVWRDPNMGTGSVGVTVSIQTTPGDLAIATPPGWAAPLVPRPANDGTPGAVPAPAFLVGDVSQTWINYAVMNPGALWIPPGPMAALYLDGATLFTESPSWPFPGGTTYRNLATPFQVRGGRHVLGLHLDYTEMNGELSESNNTTAGQWVWQPSTLSFSVPQAQPLPPERFAGWDLMPSGSPLWFNLDGLRVPDHPSPDGLGNGWKVATLAFPDAGTDIDLKLFEAATNAVTGFDSELTASGWGIDQADFVIADFRVTAPRSLDVGFLAPVVQPGASLVECRRSVYLGLGPASPTAIEPASHGTTLAPRGAVSGGSHGPFTVAAGSLFELFEVDLPTGTYEIRLVPDAGSVDWGLGVYGPGQPFFSRSDALPGGLAWEAPAGAQEVLHLTTSGGGSHSVMVWKNHRSSVNTAGSFTLQITQQTTGVPDGPATTGGRLIAGVRPNPFTSSAQVEVELAQAGAVELQVFDLSGRRIRREDYGWREPGRHEFEWDGRDEARQPVPIGVYFVQVIAGSVREERKVVRSR